MFHSGESLFQQYIANRSAKYSIKILWMQNLAIYGVCKCIQEGYQEEHLSKVRGWFVVLHGHNITCILPTLG